MASYACWPLALVHGLGSGTDASLVWMLAISASCLAVVLVAVGWRIATAWPGGDGRRALAMSAIATALLAMVVWVVSGPLGSNWAARAATPAALLTASTGSTTGGKTKQVVTSTLPFPFSSDLTGVIRQHELSGAGLVVIDIRAVSMARRRHPRDPGSRSTADRWRGFDDGQRGLDRPTRTAPALPGPPAVSAGDSFARLVSNGNESARLDVRLSIDQTTNRLTGTVTAQPTGGGNL